MKSVPTVLLALALLAPAAAFAQTTDPRLPFSSWRVKVVGQHSEIPCPGESLRVLISGYFPNPCWDIRSIEVLPRRCFPCTPLIRVVVDDGGCRAGLCAGDSIPFTREVRIAPLPAGTFEQTVNLHRVTCTDSFPPMPTATISTTFLVAEGCGGGCLIPEWGADPLVFCDATLDAEGRARIDLRIRSPRPLRALEGMIQILPDSLEITNLAPTGAAAGMTLVWNREGEGVRFVMFAPPGVPPIPATPESGIAPPVIAVHVAAPPGAPPPRTSFIVASRLLGADTEGEEIQECVTTLRELRAGHICAPEGACDANSDGRVRVGDLVTMLLCLQSSSCPGASRFDCDGSGSFALDDVLCCARRMLHLPPVPPDSARPSATRIELGEAVRTETGWRVPLRLAGLGELGAARLGLRFPAERFDVKVVRTDGSSGWLYLHDARGEELGVGLINLMAPTAAFAPEPDYLDLAIELTLKSGATSGGSVEIRSGEFSAQDGAALRIALPEGGVTIPSGVGLSAGRPNPFAEATRFAVRMERAGDARVTVHDLSGRRVATLFTGRLEPGSRELTWRGTDDHGARVQDGVYFIRCASGGDVVSRKLVLLKTR